MATVLDVAGHPDVLFQSERILRVSLSKRFCFTYEFSWRGIEGLPDAKTYHLIISVKSPHVV